MFRALTGSRVPIARSNVLFMTTRFNSTNNKNAPAGFDLLKLATESANANANATSRHNNTNTTNTRARLSNSYLDTSAAQPQAQAQQPASRRSMNIINNSAFDEDPKVVARHLPMTGPGAGTTIEVRSGNVKSALSQLARALRTEQVKDTFHKQRYHLKPSKVKTELKVKKRKEWFHAGLRQLFKSVKDARRRGY